VRACVRACVGLTVLKVDEVYLRLVHLTNDRVAGVLKEQFELLVTSFINSVIDYIDHPLNMVHACMTSQHRPPPHN